MEELCQPSLNGRGGPVAPIAIQATNFGLKNDMIQQVQNSCQFHGLLGDDAKKHLDKFLHVTQSIKVNGVIDDALRLYLFHHFLTHYATAGFDRLPKNSINAFEQMAKMFLGKYFPPSMVTKLRNEITNLRQRPDESLFEAWKCGTFMKRRLEECYDLIENMTAHHNDWDTSFQRSESSSSITSSSDQEIVALKAEMAEINKNLMRVLQVNQQVKAVTHSCETYGGPHSFSDCPATVGQNPERKRCHSQKMQTNMTSLINSNLDLKNVFGQSMKMNTASSSGLRTFPSNIVINLKENLKGITTRSGNAYQGPMIPTTSSSLPQVVECEIEVTKDTMPPTNNGSTKDVQPLVFQIETPIPTFEPVVAPIAEPVVAPVSAPKPNQKPLIPYPSIFQDQKLREKTNGQKEKIFKIFQDLNFNISFADALILMPNPPQKVTRKTGDPNKFLIPCDFPGMDECLALADLGASINIMPLSVWNKLSLPELSPTLMTLELANRSISRPIGVAEDVYVKVGKFHFPTDFVVVDFDVDPGVPLILGRSFLKTERALIDVFKGELTFRVGREAITFNLDQTSRYSANYNDMTVNRIDVIDIWLVRSIHKKFSVSPIDFLHEEVDVFLALEDDATSPKVDHSYYDPEGDIFLLEAFLNDDPSLPPPTQGNYLPQVRKELKIYEAKNDKSSIDEPPAVELKDLPPHLEYIFLEGDDKLPVIIAKDLSGIDPEFYTHKILMEDDFEPAVQHQRKVNPKIHDVIKKEVLKLLDAGLIYPISDSLWVSIVHCVPKKGGFTVVENEENELISTRLFKGWCVCIDYRKLNEATRKDHFPLLFMDQMLERLAGNEYYCFLDGFSGYFQIPIDPKDQEKTTFTCPYKTFAYRRMPFGLCNASGTFQRCMMAIFHDMIKKTMEVFMDDFSVFRNSFGTCLSYLEKMLKRCEDTNLCLNWEKSHFMVKEGIVLGHKILKNMIKVDKAKVDVIAKLPHPTTVKGIRSFLSHAGFYRRFIQDFSKIARPMTRPLKKDIRSSSPMSVLKPFKHSKEN
nr:reverse transcriptase domain-containing protein [Tanacetum cinerariifolium]